MTRRATTPQTSAPVDSEVRNYWRSRIVSTCLLYAGLLEIIPWDETDIRKLPPQVYDVTLHKCQELLDWACRKERDIGRRIPSIEHQVAADLWNLLKPYKPGSRNSPRAGETAQLELTPRISP